MRYLIGVDFGGSSTKATIINCDGDYVASSSREYPSYYPNNGWVEQRVEDGWDAFVDNIQYLLSKENINPGDVEAIAFSAASQTAVYLDENDKTVRPSIHWTDKRGVKQVAWLKEKYGEQIVNECKNPPAPSRSLVHLLWMKENEPKNFARIRKLMFVKDYIRYRLTGDYVTDYVDAMGSLLMDVDNNCWSEKYCSLLGWSTDMLPKIMNPTDIVGRITSAAAKETGLSQSTKVIVGSTDTALEVYANGAVKQGDMTIKLATAGRICPVTDHYLPHPNLVNYKHVVPGMWYPGTGMMACAASYRWYRDVFCKLEMQEADKLRVDAYELLDDGAENIPICSDGLFFQPYLQGESTNPSTCASFVGMSSFHTKAHFTRALLEGVAFGMRQHFDIIKSLGVSTDTPIIIGGGAKGALWRQIMADVLNVRLTYTANSDSSQGAAMLAGVAAGVFKTFEESAERCVTVKGFVEPIPENNKLYEEGYLRFQAIMEALKPYYASVAK